MWPSTRPPTVPNERRALRRRAGRVERRPPGRRRSRSPARSAPSATVAPPSDCGRERERARRRPPRRASRRPGSARRRADARRRLRGEERPVGPVEQVAAERRRLHAHAARAPAIACPTGAGARSSRWPASSASAPRPKRPKRGRRRPEPTRQQPRAAGVFASPQPTSSRGDPSAGRRRAAPVARRRKFRVAASLWNACSVTPVLSSPRWPLCAAPAVASAAGVAYPDADWSRGVDPVLGRRHAARRRPAAQGRHGRRPRRRSSSRSARTSTTPARPGPAGPAEGTQLRPGRPERGPVGALPGLRRGLGPAEEGLQLRDGRPARLRRLERLPRLVRARRAGGRGQRGQVGGEPAVVDRQGRHVRQVLRRADRPDRRRQAARRASARSSPRSRSTTTTATSTATACGARTRSRRPRSTTGSRRRRGPITDSPNYNVSSLNNPACLAQNFAAQAGNDNHDSDFWKLRNLIPGAAGSNVPLFLTQGLTENNTVADGLQQYLANHTGYERAWLGPWEHVRGNETARGDAPPVHAPSRPLKMGRAGWFDEVMRFYDRFLKGVTPTVGDPPIAVQTNDGKWRSEAQWPPADAPRLHDRAARRQLHRQRPSRTRPAPPTTRPRPRACGRSPSRCPTTCTSRARADGGQRHDDAAERQPGGRRLRPRRGRHRAAHHPPGPPGPHTGRLRSRWSCGRPTGSSPPVTASACA